MSVSVSEFIREYEDTIKEFYGYANLLKDVNVVGNKRAFSISNDMIGKNLLSNVYGNVCDDRLCHAFKKYARDHTVFEGER